MHYLIVFQILCGCLSAFAAGRKGRNRTLWWAIGAFVPLFGVLIALMVPEAGAGLRAPRNRRGRIEEVQADRRSRPRRCRGSYIPDCQGCPYFRRPLFDADPQPHKKGTCTFLGKELWEESAQDDSAVTVDER